MSVPETPPPSEPTYGQTAADKAAQVCAERRRRVLAHPDLAALLCKPPLRYSRPEVWNGYVPPREWREQYNDSKHREALLDILWQVADRDKQEVA